jgi:hypothetical protein
MNAGGRFITAAIEVLEGGRFHEFPRLTFIPGAAGVDLPMISFARRVIEELVDQTGVLGQSFRC